MTAFVIRSPRLSDLDALSALNIRSKAFWGYDAAFMKACEGELRLTPQDIAQTSVAVIEHNDQLVGMAQVAALDKDADLLKLFIDPPFIGTGAGRCLFDWCVSAARNMAATRLLIEADPQAAPFYQYMGAHVVGTVPSGSIPDRELPLLEFPIR